MKISLFSAILAIALTWTSFSSSDPQKAFVPEGEKLFRQLNCAMCHGSSHQGTTLAPALVGIMKNWKRAELVEYLKDPVKVTQSNPRLKKQKTLFPAKTMPSFASLRPEQMKTLVDWLMTLK